MHWKVFYKPCTLCEKVICGPLWWNTWDFAYSMLELVQWNIHILDIAKYIENRHTRFLKTIERWYMPKFRSLYSLRFSIEDVGNNNFGKSHNIFIWGDTLSSLDFHNTKTKGDVHILWNDFESLSFEFRQSIKIFNLTFFSPYTKIQKQLWVLVSARAA